MAATSSAAEVQPDVYRTLVAGLDNGVLLVDGEGTVITSNPSAERILGFDADRVCGGSEVPWTFLDERGEPVDAYDLPCQTSLRTGRRQLNVVLGVAREDGSFAWVEFNAFPTVHDRKPVAILSFADVTRRRAEQTRLRELAERDTLTGLFNRRRFDTELRREIRRASAGRHESVLLLLDLDGLKRVNDASGHAAGDKLLQDAAQRLNDELRDGDVLARYGGDEFAVLLPRADRERGEQVAARLSEALAAPGSGTSPAPVASVGMCLLDRTVVEEGSVVAAADAALYAAKQAGGGAVHRAGASAPSFVLRRDMSPEQAIERLAGDDADAMTLEGVVAASRELLGMDISYFTHHTATEQVFQALDGDAESFGVDANTRMPLEATYCYKILAGELPSLMPNLSLIPAAAEMPVTEAAGVGAYVSVPITFSGGELFGTLCCANHEARPDLSSRDVSYLRVLARLLAEQLERREAEAERQRLAVASAGLRALTAAVEARDHYTAEHSGRVVDLVAAVGRRLGLSESEVVEAEHVALLHDLGKLSVPDAILHKAGPLSDEEWAVMQTHPAEGAKIVASVAELEHLAPAVGAEHERWDGTGYPNGLAGARIPRASRITFVCDAFHAMTSDRPYRAALSFDDAVAEIRRGAGSQFCPEAAAALLAEVGGLQPG